MQLSAEDEFDKNMFFGSGTKGTSSLLLNTTECVRLEYSSNHGVNLSVQCKLRVNKVIQIYRVFSAQADWTLNDTSHKDTEQSTVQACITLNGVTLTDSLIRWSPNEWHSVCREIPVSADKMFWTSNKPAQWTLYITREDHVPNNDRPHSLS
jgi:hypothetical protein